MTPSLLCLLFLGQASPGDVAIPAHPRELVFPEFEFTPPDPARHRHVLPSGVVVYVVEDHELPLVDLTLTVRTGSYLEPAGKAGLASLVGSQMRQGGTKRQTPEDLDEELALLAAQMSVGVAETEGSASFNCLTKDLRRVLELFFDMVRTPRFDPGRLALEKSKILQDLSRRNDQTPAIESREWERLLRGPDFFSVERVTKTSIDGMTQEDLLEFHRRWFHPRHFLLAVSGDVKTSEVLGVLESFLKDWAASPPPEEKVPPVPKPGHSPRPGVYLIDKPTVNQGRVSIGHLSTTRNNPDFHTLMVMNHILGGGGFTSRIMSRVRSDEGLAYSAGSRFEFGVYYDGIFRAYFQSKSESVARAASIVLEEVERLRREKVSREEIETAINSMIGTFPRPFATAQATANTLASDEYTGRDPTFWSTFRARAKAVTEDDVLRSARQYLHPGRLLLVVVGDAGAILKGDAGGPGGGLSKLAGPAGIQRLPLPDPLTLEYPKS